MATSWRDEEATLLEEEGSEARGPSAPVSSRAWRPLIGVGAITGLAAIAWMQSTGTTGVAQRSGLEAVHELHFEKKVAESSDAVEPEAAVAPHAALQQEAKREKLGVEEDLTALGLLNTRRSHYREQISSEGGEACSQQAEQMFDDLMQESSLGQELNTQEKSAFRSRFAAAMQHRCKELHDERVFHEVAGAELQRQKPLMTEAVVASLNKAGVGFQAKMHSWLKHETEASFQGRLGYMPVPEGQGDVLQRPAGGRQANVHLPVAFRAELKWPKCKEEILRIHNQGHCGSCWAFGGVASVDARMCIATDGKWNQHEEILSRLHVVSCAPGKYFNSHDGCQGGWPHWAMVMMAKEGIASSTCLPYYIGGEGSEHFQNKDTAPPCETHCQGGYSVPLGNDTFSSAGVANYDWLRNVRGEPEKMRLTKTAILQEGPVAFAFFANRPFMSYHSGVFSVCGGESANHAVYTFGWGLMAAADGGEAVEYFEASNSWGTGWGNNGHFRIHPRCMTDVTIPGSIESTVVNHHVGTVDPDVPLDPTNPLWPWQAPDECPYVDGCITDMEGATDYSDNEKCVSDKLNGKKVTVVEFDTEKGYDELKINGRRFSGKEGAGFDANDFNGMEVNSQGIEFTSDGSVAGSGFKICAQ